MRIGGKKVDGEIGSLDVFNPFNTFTLKSALFSVGIFGILSVAG